MSLAMFRMTKIAPMCADQARGMATLKDIRNRLKSVKNIQKITKSMKMVSAAKYARAERELKPVKPFGAGAQAFYERAEVKSDEAPDAKILVIALTSDRGLCGAVHSSVAKAIKLMIQQSPNPDNIKIVCVGDKSRGMLSRIYPKNILVHFNDIGRKPPTFKDAAIVAQNIISSGYDFTKGILLYNKFKSVVSYTTTPMPIHTLAAIQAAPKIHTYDSLDSDVLQNYQEYSLASLIYYAMKENATSEQSSRMTAMDNASKNAGEMIDKLTLTFNRTRQAVITRELIEIISGASALNK